ncbi:maleylpyruvate isomerase N-terminal domain-containing protein [Mycobacterium sp. Y57]|uniref:maleylpyruvate isomerase N-terminal domain-containing protein n=1 Tax=Mycolicibacterium xanthum TaxID=2796469 RepID=UPI001C84ABB2|nr:maleylpyruvate isomerase N-terminal domain-containing protein [Mycolicibacterium xanthum]MBX7431889.1 maleylpyruvate isomerase N-terminal domain-containing protein [Mycolicibacterium xanthum]
MDFRAALLEQTRAFGELIRPADPATPVPTCGDWTLKQLFRHVGRGNRWAAQIIHDRLSQPLDPRDVRGGKAPDDPDAALDWLDEGARLVIDAVDHVGPETRVWTFLGPRPAGWWIRRRLHEATVHRADAALALGAGFELSPELSGDALSEWIERVCVDRRHPVALDLGQSIHLHATEEKLGPTGEWTIVHDSGGVWWSHSHAKGTVALRGPVTELLLAIVRRKTAAEAGLEVFGDTTVWDAWLDSTPY